MKICFLDPNGPGYTLLTPDHAPLDDVRSLFCYLARELAYSHEVTLIARHSAVGMAQDNAPPAQIGVPRQLGPAALPGDFWATAGFDAIIALDDWQALLALAALPAQMLCWYHRPDCSDPHALAQALDSGRLALVCVSNWQRLELLRQLPGERIYVFPDVVAPAFGQGFHNSEQLLQSKSGPLTLAWPATLPGPGPQVLLNLVPALQQQFSHLQIVPIAPCSKPELAALLRQVHVFAWPAVAPESSSPMMLEAMASGCRVVCPDLGSLAESCTGMARLVPGDPGDRTWWMRYFEALCQELARWKSDQDQLGRQQLAQTMNVLEDALWPLRAVQWLNLIQALNLTLNLAQNQPMPRSPVTVKPSPLRWCFLDDNALDYQIASPETLPLGGSQSALCYLARQLAVRGHQVSLANHTTEPGQHLGVACHRLDQLEPDFWHGFDLVVSLNEFNPLLQLPGSARRVFWNQHNQRVPGVDKLPRALEQLDAVVYVSAWQQSAYQYAYGLPPGWVIPNAASPFYAPLSPDIDTFIAARPGPLTLAYISTPNRGLSVLIALFPGLRMIFPELRLKVFSSLRVYQSPQDEEDEFLPLYAECRQLEGVEYIGSVPQPQLAAALQGVHILAYPNVYEETSCIAVIEAMSAGCQIVTTRLGALPETSAGFAQLVPFSYETREFGVFFFEVLRAALAQWCSNPAPLVARLLEQHRFAQSHYSWERQAGLWETMAKQITTNSFKMGESEL